MKYLVTVTETLSCSFVVNAESKEAAMEKMNKEYNKGFSLADHDYNFDCEIEVLGEALDSEATYYEELITDDIE